MDFICTFYPTKCTNSSCRSTETIVDPSCGETVCTMCGLVLSDCPIDYSSEYRRFDGDGARNLLRERTSRSVLDVDQETYYSVLAEEGNISGNGKGKKSGMPNKAKPPKIVSSRTSAQQVNEAFIEIETVIDMSSNKFQIPQVVLHTAKDMARLLFAESGSGKIQKELGKSGVSVPASERLTAIAVGCLVGACQRHQVVNVTRRDLIRLFNVKEAVAMAVEAFLKNVLFEKVPKHDSIEFIEEFSNHTDVNAQMKTIMVHMLEKFKKDVYLKSKNHATMAALALFAVVSKGDLKFSADRRKKFEDISRMNATILDSPVYYKKGDMRRWYEEMQAKIDEDSGRKIDSNADAEEEWDWEIDSDMFSENDEDSDSEVEEVEQKRDLKVTKTISKKRKEDKNLKSKGNRGKK